MAIIRILHLSSVAAILLVSQTTFAQVGQIGGGGNNAGTTSATAAGVGGGATVGTTEGIGGVTTQGVPGGDATAGTAGNNTAEVFVGGNNAGGFVGGGVGTQRNNSRQFQGINNTTVPTGGGAQTSGTPRRVAVSLRVSFAFPRPNAGTSLMPAAGPAIERVSKIRPELRNVKVGYSANGVVTLTGFTPDAGSSRLAANLVRLRPGVRRVDNQLSIAAQ